jgi:hypothetical protein
LEGEEEEEKRREEKRREVDCLLWKLSLELPITLAYVHPLLRDGHSLDKLLMRGEHLSIGHHHAMTRNGAAVVNLPRNPYISLLLVSPGNKEAEMIIKTPSTRACMYATEWSCHPLNVMQ